MPQRVQEDDDRPGALDRARAKWQMPTRQQMVWWVPGGIVLTVLLLVQAVNSPHVWERCADAGAFVAYWTLGTGLAGLARRKHGGDVLVLQGGGNLPGRMDLPALMERLARAEEQLAAQDEAWQAWYKAHGLSRSAFTVIDGGA